MCSQTRLFIKAAFPQFGQISPLLHRTVLDIFHICALSSYCMQSWVPPLHWQNRKRRKTETKTQTEKLGRNRKIDADFCSIWKALMKGCWHASLWECHWFHIWGLYYKAGFSLSRLTSGKTRAFRSYDAGSLFSGLDPHGNLCWAANLLGRRLGCRLRDQLSESTACWPIRAPCVRSLKLSSNITG